ncbi:hypothetical protein AB1207_07585 [Kineococcus endophyticus]|uniref:MYXO-CTERM domain-containing protein n=1 Tax=Kineococcus endophyticus TaxID=1181883 RepID=A0ABV3P4Q6_9ACTN
MDRPTAPRTSTPRFVVASVVGGLAVAMLAALAFGDSPVRAALEGVAVVVVLLALGGAERWTRGRTRGTSR